MILYDTSSLFKRKENIMFQKRLDENGIKESKYYSSKENPFVASNYGMPNCTCYCYGRVWELNKEKPVGLSLRNGKYWYNESTGFEKGQVPKVGAVMCFDGAYGHTAMVEEVKENGDVVCSNSNYGGPFFFVTTHTASSGYNNYDKSLKFQGFIYAYKGVEEDREENNSTQYKVGDTVNYHSIYTSSTSDQSLNPVYTRGTITKIVPGSRNPYLIGSGTGWINDNSINERTDNDQSITVGSMVKVKDGAKSYEGVSIASFVYKNTYRVDELKNDRAVLDKNGIRTAFRVNDLIKE